MSEHDLNPADFDLDSWIEGASRPERTVTVYREGKLLADLDELDERIKLARAVPAEQRGITDASPESLQAEWDALAERFGASALKVRVRAITNEEYAKAHRAALEECGGEDKADPEVIGLHVVAAAVAWPKMTVPQVRALRDAIGEPQVGMIAAAATELRLKGLPKVTVPFSRPSSTNHAGHTS